MEELGAWFDQDFLIEAQSWIGAVGEAGTAAPWPSASFIALAVLIGLIARSFLIFFTAIVLGAFTVWLLASTTSPILGVELAGLGTLALVALMAGSYGLRRAISRQRAALEQLASEKAEIQHLLDREIQWRMAADPDPSVQNPK